MIDAFPRWPPGSHQPLSAIISRKTLASGIAALTIPSSVKSKGAAAGRRRPRRPPGAYSAKLEPCDGPTAGLVAGRRADQETGAVSLPLMGVCDPGGPKKSAAGWRWSAWQRLNIKTELPDAGRIWRKV